MRPASGLNSIAQWNFRQNYQSKGLRPSLCKHPMQSPNEIEFRYTVCHYPSQVHSFFIKVVNWFVCHQYSQFWPGSRPINNLLAMRFLPLLLVLIQGIGLQAQGWALPSGTFLSEFVAKHDLASITLHLPSTSQISLNDIKTNMREITNLDQKFIVPLNYVSSSTTKNVSGLTYDQDLHVYLLNDQDLPSSIESFVSIYATRELASREYWLVDITSMNADGLAEDLKDLKLDLDDDLFLYKVKDDGIIDIWEAYKIHKDYDISLIYYGNYTTELGLTVQREEKWSRRRDLQGVKFKCVTLESRPYITQMDPVPNQPEEYTMEGMFAEVFIALQVLYFLAPFSPLMKQFII